MDKNVVFVKFRLGKCKCRLLCIYFSFEGVPQEQYCMLSYHMLSYAPSKIVVKSLDNKNTTVAYHNGRRREKKILVEGRN